VRAGKTVDGATTKFTYSSGGDFCFDAALTGLTLGAGGLASGDEFAELVVGSGFTTLQSLLSVGEAACWDGF